MNMPVSKVFDPITWHFRYHDFCKIETTLTDTVWEWGCAGRTPDGHCVGVGVCFWLCGFAGVFCLCGSAGVFLAVWVCGCVLTVWSALVFLAVWVCGCDLCKVG